MADKVPMAQRQRFPQEENYLNDNDKLLTVIMPAKNASRFIERSLGSIRKQTLVEKISVLLVYAKSNDNTLNLVKEYCNKFNLDLHIYHEKGELNPEMTSFIIPSIETKYFCFMCFSDEYIRPQYLEEAVTLMEADSKYSYVHSNIYTMFNGDNLNKCFLRPGLFNRQLVPSQSGAAMFSNLIALDDSINELTFICRTKTAKSILEIHKYSYKLRHNVFGSIFLGLFLNGCIGYYISNFSTIGYHHENQAGMNPEVEDKCGLYREKFNQLRTKLDQLITQSRSFWKDPNMTPFPMEIQKKLNEQYFYQHSMIKLCAKYHLFNGH